MTYTCGCGTVGEAKTCFDCSQHIRRGASAEEAYQITTAHREQEASTTVIPAPIRRPRPRDMTPEQRKAADEEWNRSVESRDAANKRARQLLADDNGVAELADSIAANAREAGEGNELLEGLWDGTPPGEHYDR